MKANEYFSYENPTFAPLRDPARGVVDAMQRANRFLDTIQEWLWIEAGLIYTSRFIHDMAHEFPKAFDSFIDMLHERHLSGEYPATPELTEPITDESKAFEMVVKVLSDVDEALEKFHTVTDTAAFRPMALKTEELMLENSGRYTKVLEAWTMWDKAVSPSSFDNWILHIGGACNAAE